MFLTKPQRYYIFVSRGEQLPTCWFEAELARGYPPQVEASGGGKLILRSFVADVRARVDLCVFPLFWWDVTEVDYTPTFWFGDCQPPALSLHQVEDVESVVTRAALRCSRSLARESIAFERVRRREGGLSSTVAHASANLSRRRVEPTKCKLWDDATQNLMRSLGRHSSWA